MMGVAGSKDVGAFIKSVLGLAPVRVTAGGGADNVDQNGPAIDREGYLSCEFSLVAQGVLATLETAAVDARIQDSADGSTGWNNYGDPAPTLNLADGVNNERGMTNGKLNLDGAKRFIRLVGKTNPSAGSTDTVDIAGVVTLGGPNELPAT
jgi:hypothetical protein